MILSDLYNPDFKNTVLFNVK